MYLKKIYFKLYLYIGAVMNFRMRVLNIIIAASTLTVLALSVLFAEDVNVIMKDGSLIKGSLIGKTADQVVIQEAGGKAETVNISDIRGVFDQATGNPVDLRVKGTPVPGENKVIIYRPREVVIEGPRNAFGVDLLGLTLGTVRLLYERALADWFSIRIDGTYGYNYYWYSGINYWSAAAYGRFYFGHSMPCTILCIKVSAGRF